MAKIWNFMKSGSAKSKKLDKKDNKKRAKPHAIDPDDNMVEEMISKTKKK